MSSAQFISLRPAVEADIPFLESLRQITMRSLIENHYAWDDQTQRARVLAHFDCAQIVVVDGCDIGLFKVVHGIADLHLSQIQLLPTYQGQGIASTLIRKLQDEILPSGFPITLHVLRSNRAISLYRRFGFVVEHEDEHFFFMKWPPISKKRTPKK